MIIKVAGPSVHILLQVITATSARILSDNAHMQAFPLLLCEIDFISFLCSLNLYSLQLVCVFHSIRDIFIHLMEQFNYTTSTLTVHSEYD